MALAWEVTQLVLKVVLASVYHAVIHLSAMFVNQVSQLMPKELAYHAFLTVEIAQELHKESAYLVEMDFT